MGFGIGFSMPPLSSLKCKVGISAKNLRRFMRVDKWVHDEIAAKSSTRNLKALKESMCPSVVGLEMMGSCGGKSPSINNGIYRM